MTITELFTLGRKRPLTPYQQWCLGEIEKAKNYEIVVEGDTATIYGKKSSEAREC